MGVWYRIGARFRHPRIEEGNAPAIAPPLAIMMFIPIAALWLAFMLFYSATPDMILGRQIVLALLGGVAPIGIAYGVMTNRRWTRTGILATVAANIWFFEVVSGMPFIEQLFSNLRLSIEVVAWLALCVYLYSGAVPRAYYLLISGRPLPEELREVDLSPPKWLESGMQGLAVCAEWMLIVLAIGMFVGLVFFLPQVTDWLYR